jgi:hypothetical protein
MTIGLELPEDIAKDLEAAWHDVARGAREAVAVEGYRDGTLTRDEIGRLLGLSFWETEAFAGAAACASLRDSASSGRGTRRARLRKIGAAPQGAWNYAATTSV